MKSEAEYSVAENTVHPACSHCGQPTTNQIIWGDHAFCCGGCRQVYKIIHDQGLSNFYALRDSVNGSSSTGIAVEKQRDFSFCNSEAFLSKYAYGSHNQFLDVYIEGAHCAACLWLLEKTEDYVAGIESARLNLTNNILTLKGVPGSFPLALQQIQDWGYIPHPVQSNEDQSRHRNSDRKQDLKRIGVAGFGAGNIMLLSVAIYAGLDGGLKDYFVAVSFLLSLPVLLYSAIPLYQNSWISLRRQQISIDLPIVIALVVAFSASVVGLFNGGLTYFDSVTALVFLILTSRFLLKAIQQRHIGLSNVELFLDLSTARVWNGTSYLTVSAEALKVGDRVHLKEGEIVPADGEVIGGHGYLNQSLISGECAPMAIKSHQPVLMGAQLVSGEIEFVVSQDFQNSRIQKLLKSLSAESKNSKAAAFMESVAQYFLGLVFSTAIVVVAMWWTVDVREGLFRALSFMIVVCPCTFASVVPLVLVMALHKSARNGIFVKDSSLFERAGKVKDIFFDKTGVLTEGVFEVVSIDWLRPPTLEMVSKIHAVATFSPHPVSRALAHHFDLGPLSEHSYQARVIMEKSAQGLEVRLSSGDRIRFDKSNSVSSSELGIPKIIDIFINDICVAKVELGDRVRQDAKNLISHLHRLGYRCWIISGDQSAVVHAVASALGIPAERAIGELDFYGKEKYMQTHPNAIMVGDGNNDALALKKSAIGVAFSGGVESALQSSDVYIAQPKLSSLREFLTLASSTHKMIVLSLVVSLCYNLTAGTLALFGFIHPLLAALIMPLNAMTVFLICLFVYRERKN